MRITAGCAAVLLTLVHCLVVDAAKSRRREFDFHVSNLQRDGVRRTVVNGRSPFFLFSLPADGLTYASPRSIPR